jgi:hypothetical protein
MSRLLDDGSATEYLRIDGVSLAFFNNQNTPALRPAEKAINGY